MRALKATLEVKNSFVRNDHSDLIKRFVIMQKKYYDLLMYFNANHFKLKHLEENLRKCESNEVTLRTISFDTPNDQIDQIW